MRSLFSSLAAPLNSQNGRLNLEESNNVNEMAKYRKLVGDWRGVFSIEQMMRLIQAFFVYEIIFFVTRFFSTHYPKYL